MPGIAWTMRQVLTFKIMNDFATVTTPDNLNTPLRLTKPVNLLLPRTPKQGQDWDTTIANWQGLR